MSARQRGVAAVAAVLTLIAACGRGGASTEVESPAPVSTAAPTTIASTTTTIASTTTTIASTTTTATVVDTTAAVASTTDPAPPPVDAAAYAVYDVGSNRWLAEFEADAPRPVGSVMKLLTAFVAMQAGDPTHVATVPALQLGATESAIGLYEGERLSREVLLRAMLIASANDAARTLAVDVAGGEEAFVSAMNDAAVALNLVNTVAANSVGLDAEGAHSSARDVVVLATVLMGDPTFRSSVARTEARMHGQTFAATNALLESYEGATGVKTGHTSAAEWCVVGSASRGGREVIVAVLGAPSDSARIAAATALLDWAFTSR